MSDSNKKILALETKISKFSKKNDSAPPKAGNNPPRPPLAPGKAPKSGKKATPKWMTRFPDAGFVAAGKPKTVDGKQYWWCPKHKRFVQHKLSECRLTSPSANTPSAPPTS
jgi:hypothetical protein